MILVAVVRFTRYLFKEIFSSDILLLHMKDRQVFLIHPHLSLVSPAHRQGIFNLPDFLLLKRWIEARYASLCILIHKIVWGNQHKVGPPCEAPHLLGPFQRSFANLSEINQSPSKSIRYRVIKN